MANRVDCEFALINPVCRTIHSLEIYIHIKYIPKYAYMQIIRVYVLSELLTSSTLKFRGELRRIAQN